MSKLIASFAAQDTDVAVCTCPVRHKKPVHLRIQGKFIDVMVVRYSFLWTIPSNFNWCFTSVPLVLSVGKLHQFLGKD